MITYDDIAEWYDQWVGTYPMHDDPTILIVRCRKNDQNE